MSFMAQTAALKATLQPQASFCSTLPPNSVVTGYTIEATLLVSTHLPIKISPIRHTLLLFVSIVKFVKGLSTKTKRIQLSDH